MYIRHKLISSETMTDSAKLKNIYTFKDEKPTPFDCKYTPAIRDQHVPLIIDNGNKYNSDILFDFHFNAYILTHEIDTLKC